MWNIKNVIGSDEGLEEGLSPSFQEWYGEISREAANEEMIYRRTDRMDKYIRKWGGFIMCMANRT